MMTIKSFLSLGLLSGCVFVLSDVMSRHSISAQALAQADKPSQLVDAQGQPVLLAKAETKKKAVKKDGGGAPMREKTITREKIYRGESKKVDFDAIDIGGERKSPFGSMVNQNKANKEYDLIKIRLRWHDEMKQSTSSLENGRSKS